MSLAPYFVLWAGIAVTNLAVAAGVVWLVRHEPLQALLAALWPGDWVVAWLAFLLLHHAWKAGREPLLAVLGGPWALLVVTGVVVLYAVLRAVPGPWRRPGPLFVLAVLGWAFAIGAGWQYIDETRSDLAVLQEAPMRLLEADSDPRPLLRGLLLSQVERATVATTRRALQARAGEVPLTPGLQDAWRLRAAPALREHYGYDLAKLRTYQWVQTGLLAAALLLWGFGRRPGGG